MQYSKCFALPFKSAVQNLSRRFKFIFWSKKFPKKMQHHQLGFLEHGIFEIYHLAQASSFESALQFRVS